MIRAALFTIIALAGLAFVIAVSPRCGPNALGSAIGNMLVGGCPERMRRQGNRTMTHPIPNTPAGGRHA